MSDPNQSTPLGEPRIATESDPQGNTNAHAIAAPLSTTEATRKRRPAISSDWGWITSFQSLAVTIVIAVFVITFLVQAFEIPSESMEDTLLIGDYLLVDKVHFAQGGIWNEVLPYSRIRRGDMVVFRYPMHPQEHFVKRVIGLPGDHLRLLHRHIYINGKLISEPYVVFKESFPDPFRDNFPNGDAVSPEMTARWRVQMKNSVQNGELIVPDGSYFVMGDNRNQSSDSRYWGFVPRENIVGRPLVIYMSIQTRHSDDDEDDDLMPANGKLLSWRDNLAHVWQRLRWNRILRLVR